MKKYLEILKRCPLFYGIEEKNLLNMLICLGAKTDVFDKKYSIMAEGGSAKYIGIVLSGSAQIVQVDYFGNRNILSIIKPSQVFCEAFACAETESLPVSVIANEKCEIMIIDVKHILATCNNNCPFHRQLIFNLMRDIAAKTVLFHQKIEVMSKRSTREKLMAYLMFEAKKHNSRRFYIPFDRQELADYLTVDRSGLSAEISKLRSEGILESHKNYFELIE